MRERLRFTAGILEVGQERGRARASVHVHEALCCGHLELLLDQHLQAAVEV